MGKADELHELIYANLSLLKAGGHHIDFKQGMFREHNLPGFEAVGHALLMIIDPTECKSKIPWPLINDKSQTREFRTNFTKFVKMINSRYPDAQIPEINASSLQFPGGMNFLYFMYKLSKFALELELKKTMSSGERENLLRKPILSKQIKDQRVKLMMVRGALRREEEAWLQFKEYETDGPSILKKMNDYLNDITTNYKSVSEQLKLQVSSLDFDDQTKESLINIEDTIAITDYNEKIERKSKELEETSHKLSRLHGLAAQCSQQSKLSLQTHEETQCLDGHKLGFTRYLNELAGGPVVNVDGELKLLEVVRAAHAAVTRLTRTSSSSSLLSPARDLQAQCSSVASRAFKAESALQRLAQETRQAVHALRPSEYSTVKKKKVPDAFKHLIERPVLNFVLPHSVVKRDIATRPGRRRKSFGSVIHRRNKVVCTFKTKREPKKHVSSTPFFKSPACRKSLYNTLPSGKRHKCIEEDKPLEVTLDNPIPLTPVMSSTRESEVGEPSTFNSCSTDDTGSPHPTPAPRCGRKSINDIVERFLKLKRSMNMSSNSKNGSDICNESETSVAL